MSSQTIIRGIAKTLSKNSPTIFTGLAVAGAFTTTYMAIDATPKALRILEKEGYPHVQIPRKEIIKLTWRCYAPTAAMLLITTGCMVASNSINLRRNAALASLYSITESTLKEYQSQVKKKIGEKKEQEIRDEVYKEKIVQNPVDNSSIIFTGKGETLCFDVTSGRYFKSEIERIRQVRNELNDLLIKDMFVPLNELYYLLGLPETSLGKEIGWDHQEGLIEFIYSSQLAEGGVPCLVIDYNIEPRYNFRDY